MDNPLKVKSMTTLQNETQDTAHQSLTDDSIKISYIHGIVKNLVDADNTIKKGYFIKSAESYTLLVCGWLNIGLYGEYNKMKSEEDVERAWEKIWEAVELGRRGR